MRVWLTEPAESDLREIGDFIAEDNAGRAASFVQELVDRCQGLAKHAKRYPVVTMLEGREVRRCPHGSYLIFYAVANDLVEIHHIVHGSRDFMRLLFPDD